MLRPAKQRYHCECYVVQFELLYSTRIEAILSSLKQAPAGEKKEPSCCVYENPKGDPVRPGHTFSPPFSSISQPPPSHFYSAEFPAANNEAVGLTELQSGASNLAVDLARARTEVILLSWPTWRWEGLAWLGIRYSSLGPDCLDFCSRSILIMGLDWDWRASGRFW